MSYDAVNRKLRARHAGIAFFVADAALTLGATWWWALLGLKDQIGNAVVVTVIVFALLGFWCLEVGAS